MRVTRNVQSLKTSTVLNKTDENHKHYADPKIIEPYYRMSHTRAQNII